LDKDRSAMRWKRKADEDVLEQRVRELAKCEDRFVNLGGVSSQNVNCNKDLVRRIGLAAGIVTSRSSHS